MPHSQVLEDEISAGADRSEECCDKQTEVEHRRASRGSPILCYLRTDLHLSGFAVPRHRQLPRRGRRPPPRALLARRSDAQGIRVRRTRAARSWVGRSRAGCLTSTSVSPRDIRGGRHFLVAQVSSGEVPRHRLSRGGDRQSEPGAPHRRAHPGAHAGHRRPRLLPSQTRRWQESERGAALPQTPTLGRRLPMHGGRCSHLRYRGRLTQRLRPTPGRSLCARRRHHVSLC